MHLSIYPLTEDDFDGADAVVNAAYGRVRNRRDVYLRDMALPSFGAFVAKDDDNGAVVGFGTVVDYDTFAYVGMMSTLPEMQRRGIGARLMEHILAWLDERGCPTVLLDASAAGEPLYPRFGFVEIDGTAHLQQVEHVLLPRHLPSGVSVLQDDEFEALCAFDAAHFGGNRAELLANYRADMPQRVLVAHDVNSEKREIVGYLIAQAHALGPWVACSRDDAERLLVHALALSFSTSPAVFVSASNADACSLLERYGFKQQRVLKHMRKGHPIERERGTTLYGQASLGLG